MVKKQSNDSLAQKKAKQQNQQNTRHDDVGNRHTEGPNHPST